MRGYTIRYLLVLAVIAVIGCGTDAVTAPPQAGPPDGVEIITPLAPLPTSTAAAFTTPGDRLKAIYDVVIDVEWNPDSRTVGFTARILGGPDTNPYLRCTTTGWEFGDGTGSMEVPQCVPDTEERLIQRLFSTRHSYDVAGVYEVTFSRGELTADPVLIAVEMAE